jgi:arginase
MPFMDGDPEHPAAAGPGRCVEAVRARAGADGVETVAVAADAPRRRLAELVHDAIARDRFPVVLAGSCDAALGVLAGFDHSRCGVVWLDAHGDFNTPESSVSGFVPGMTLAAVAGHCHRDQWAELGHSEPVAEASIALIGVRDLSPEAERERLERSALEVVPWSAGRAGGDVPAALDRLSERVGEIYLHIDLDAFDPEIAPGVVDEPVPGGLSAADGEAIVRAAVERFDVRAAAITTYVPGRDRDNRTLDLQVALIELLM